MRLSSFIDAHAVRTPHKTALIVGDERVSYAELRTRIHHVARGLHRLGLRSGDRIAIYVPNSVEFVTTTYAALALGAVVIPVNTRNTLDELVYFVAEAQASFVIVQDELDDATRQKFADHDRLTFVAIDGAAASETSYAALSAPSDTRLPDVPVACDEAFILFTAGTTGKPKGAVLTHANFILTNGYANTVQWGITEHDVNLVTTPLAHRTGLARMVNALCLGAKLVVMKRFDVAASIDLIEAEEVTVIGMVPTVGRMMLPLMQAAPDRCRSLRHLLVTGEAFPVELKRQLSQLLPQVRLCSFFAMTEAGAVTALYHEEQITHAASVGRVSPGIEVRLVDEKAQEVTTNEVGEIWVRSGTPGQFTTMKMYYNRPRETAETIENGWIKTGDLGRFDAEGYLYIVDRKKDMILSGGFNIYTKEVEQALLAHPDIADAAVIGIPDEIFGESVVAFVQARSGVELAAESVQEFTKSKIASYKKPKHVFFVQDFPRNALGKVLKVELRKVALQNLGK
jgi:long-chain acyl-CoA synthetase